MVLEELENGLGIQVSFEYQEYGRYLGYVQGEIPGRVAIFCNAFSMNQAPLAAAATMADPQTLVLYCAEDDNNILLEIRQYE